MSFDVAKLEPWLFANEDDEEWDPGDLNELEDT